MTLELPNIRLAVEIVGVVAFALSGFTEALRRGFDAVGVCFVAGLTAFGGGTIRDVLLGRRPLVWLEHDGWLWTVLALCLGGLFLLRQKHLPRTENWIQVPDAIGLGLFAAGGTSIALDLATPAFGAALMGLVTATFGGVLRDVVCNTLPRAFTDHRPYALCALAAGATVVFARMLELPAPGPILLGAALGTTLRLMALLRNWQLPAWRPD